MNSVLQRHRRPGVALIMAMVCLALAAILMSLILQTVMMRRGVARDEARRLQAAWLADSALQRAAARLADNHEYAGEMWKIAADAFDGRHPAVVLIEVIASDDDARRRIVRVRSDFPDDPAHRARQTKQVTVVLPADERASLDTPSSQDGAGFSVSPLFLCSESHGRLARSVTMSLRNEPLRGDTL